MKNTKGEAKKKKIKENKKVLNNVNLKIRKYY